MILIKEFGVFLIYHDDELLVTDKHGVVWSGSRGVGPKIGDVFKSLDDCGFATINDFYKGYRIITEIIQKKYITGHTIAYHVFDSYGLIKANLRSKRAAKILITKIQKEGSSNDI